MSECDWDAAALHATEKDAVGRLDLHGRKPCFKAATLIRRKQRPVFSAGNETCTAKHTEHLASIAHAEGECLFALEEGREFSIHVW